MDLEKEISTELAQLPDQRAVERQGARSRIVHYRKAVIRVLALAACFAVSFVVGSLIIYKNIELGGHEVHVAGFGFNESIQLGKLLIEEVPESELPSAVRSGFAPYDRRWLWLGIVESGGFNFIHYWHQQSDMNTAGVKKGIETLAFLISLISLKSYWSVLEIVGDILGASASAEYQSGQVGPAHILAGVAVPISMWPFAAMLEKMAVEIGTTFTILIYIAIHFCGYGVAFTLAGSMS